MKDMRSHKILVVDDSKITQKVCQTLLREYTLVYAGDGLEALRLIAADHEIELVLLDLNMPRLGGGDFLDKLKACVKHRHLPVIIISAEQPDHASVQPLLRHAADYIQKPFEHGKLRAAVERLFA